MRNAALLCLGFVAVGSNTWAMDCRKAATPSEKAICANKELQGLDEDLGRAYGEAKAKGDAKALLADQRKWLENRETRCGAKAECLKEMTQSRIRELLPQYHISWRSSPNGYCSFMTQIASLEALGLDGAVQGKISSALNARIAAFSEEQAAANTDCCASSEDRCGGKRNGYRQEIRAEIGGVTKGVLSIKVESYDYERGDAHPHLVVLGQMFEKKTGDEIPFSKLFDNPDRLLKLIDHDLEKTLAKALKEEGRSPEDVAETVGASLAERNPRPQFFLSKRNFVFVGFFSEHAIAGLSAEIPIEKIMPLVAEQFRPLLEMP